MNWADELSAIEQMRKAGADTYHHWQAKDGKPVLLLTRIELECRRAMIRLGLPLDEHSRWFIAFAEGMNEEGGAVYELHASRGEGPKPPRKAKAKTNG